MSKLDPALKTGIKICTIYAQIRIPRVKKPQGRQIYAQFRVPRTKQPQGRQIYAQIPVTTNRRFAYV